MTQWQMQVFGRLHLELNADDDRIEELTNQHRTVRQMLRHSGWAGEEKRWSVQTLKDNLRLFTRSKLHIGCRVPEAMFTVKNQVAPVTVGPR